MDALNSWKEEKCSAYLYRILASKEANLQYQKMFTALANAADAQAELWLREMQKSGIAAPKDFKVNLRTRCVGKLVKLFGSRQMRSILTAMKVRGMSIYLESPPGHPTPKHVEEIGQRHRGNIKNANNLRAAIFGVNDGLVSNASLILGMVGATTNHHIIILAGVAGLLAGAFSMAAGEYISVRSQREMFEYQIALEKEELDLYPEEETEELALIYQARGLPEAEARKVATAIMQDPVNALDVLAREELGIVPSELSSPWGAGISSFLAFSIGALIPLIPFFFGGSAIHLISSIALTGLFLFAIGTALSLYTGRNALLGGLRMLLIGGAAGTITYLIGRILGGVLG
jgi:VIT1/CCC1 family predicted Fe2+/Mn2+ transporter